ncbi:MAG: hypothetical protein ACLQBK_03000 [Candidatus Sulfotelmatobacter sp.]
MKLRIGCVVVGCLSSALSLAAQTSANNPALAQVPPLIQFSNVATDEGGNSLSGVVNITFSLYAGQRGGEPLWTENQNNVSLDPTGHYSVQLGITKPNGVPTTLFTTGEARWLGVQIAGQPEQPRVLLLSVPYALKAGDAATIGGLPPSAFVLAAPPNGAASGSTTESATEQSVSPTTATDVTTTGGTANYLPVFNAAATIIDSVVYQSGTASTAKIGINTGTPATTLDVKGATTIRGTLSLPATGQATASAGTNSQGLNLAASTYDTTLAKAVNQTFRWQAEPAGCPGCVPSGTLSLLFGSNGATPGETGLNVASNGVITFAPSQTFPGTGTGDGTVTSVSSGAGLTGGPITGSGMLSIATGGVSNAMLANPSLTVAAGTDLTGGAKVMLGGSTTLSLDTTKVPQLASANTFTANQMITANLGIGTTAPAYTLDVHGTGNFTGPITFAAGQTFPGTITSVSAGVGLTGGGASGAVALAVDVTKIPRLNGTNAFTGNQTVTGNLSITGNFTALRSISGLTGTFSGNNSSSVVIASQSGSGVGLAARAGENSALTASNDGTTGYPAAVFANLATSGSAPGIKVNSSSPLGIGILANANGSTTSIAAAEPVAIWADTPGSLTASCEPASHGYPCGVAVRGTVVNGNAFAGFSSDGFNDIYDATAVFQNEAGQGDALTLAAYGGAVGGVCTIDVSGDLTCNGKITGVAAVNSGRQKVALYAVQSPENWFEDFGSGKLSNGSGVIVLEPTFAQTVNTGRDYHVFLTPKADCKGLYVTNETAAGFEVRELGGGTSNAAFDYRVVAKRRGYENIRLANMTEQFEIPEHASGRATITAPALPKLQNPGTVSPAHPVSQFGEPPALNRK